MQKIDAPGLLMSKLTVSPVKDTRIVNVRVEDIDPKRASLLANEVAEAYIAENLALRLRISESANRWLEERLGELEEKTKQSEIAVYDFKKDADMLTTSLEDRASIVSQRLNTYNGALTDVRTRVAGLKARVDALESLRSGKNPEATPAYVLGTGGAQGPLVTLKTRYLTEKGDCAALSERYLPGHPKLATCLQRVAEARADLEREAGAVIQAARLDLTEALAREKNLEKLLDLTKAEAFEVNKRQIEFERHQARLGQQPTTL